MKRKRGKKQSFVLDHLSGYNLQLPVVFDPESILDDDARTDHVSGEQFTKIQKHFVVRLKQQVMML